MHDWEKHRFKDLISLGERARGGHCAHTTVTIHEGEHLLTLLSEAVQYQEAHVHSQQLRAEAERRVAEIGVLVAGEPKHLSDGASRIAAERRRQVDMEKWTPDHDAGHEPGILAKAGIRYAEEATVVMTGRAPWPRAVWPWAGEWWKPSADPIRNLEKAGALIAAEIDRLLRLDGQR